jgi:TatD DNase family protein
MGDQVVVEAKTPSSCPCCSFLPEFTFLPPNLMRAEEYDNQKGDPSSVSVNSTDALRQIAAAGQAAKGSKSQVLLVDTHGHAHLDRERHESYNMDSENEFASVPVVSLSCAVEEADWEKCLLYASQSESMLPGLGVHPWYLENLSENWLRSLESLLVQHPSAIVGEIGLCKVARFVRTHPEGKRAALLQQRHVFSEQMQLASKLQRPVSVHCVKQHGVFMNVVKELVEKGDPFPPAVGMHSFTGTAHHVKEILAFESEWFPGRRIFYFGFSHIVNYEMCTSEKSKRQGREAVCSVPVDRLMAESDVSSANHVRIGTAGAVAYIAQCLDRPILDIARLTALNGLAFLTTMQKVSTIH